ncbi:MAG: N-acetylmuramoyl-L-alanine amidase [Rhodobacterales bacterium]|nr:N-acetylmuramoyl-L-alanine amidase [Rhodobacterales bacterium]
MQGARQRAGGRRGVRQFVIGRALLVLALLLVAPRPALAQDFTGLARLDVAQSQLRDGPQGRLDLTLYLSQPVPYRAFTLDDPRRLVIDFREVDWRGATRAAMLNADGATDLRFGVLRPGWSRMVVDLAGPMLLDAAGMAVDKVTGTATLHVVLRPATAEAHAAAAGAPPDAGWDMLAALDVTLPAPPPAEDGPLVVVIDPGHGGIDPGAERDGMVEAQVMLQLAQEVAEALGRLDDIRPVLTRQADIFVPLADRMTLARAAGADVLVSLHADALEADQASGASVYTLSAEAVDQASARMAERHDRGDLLAGVDLSGQDDTVAMILMDMARLETGPQGARLADALVAGLRDSGARLNSRPRREGPLAVLNAADFPSVLVEVGFLSSERDRAALATPEGRAPLVAGIVLALQRWAADEAARAALVRQ